MALVRSALLVSALALFACSASPTEPPPPSRKPELVPAPPHARGARAAGTDAAPKPDLGLPTTADGLAPEAPTEPAPDAGAPDAPGTAATPDAGTAL
ncbi:MAG: hypothetical protein EOO73_31705 [Myxococcales bacterium]|nr:MAG: hypothetical protein EOO73_31705 [Myxococcales bacterium]